MIKGIVALCWIGVISFLYIRDWDPLQIYHPLSLFVREMVFIAEDIPAAFLKLFSQGITALLGTALLLCAALGAGHVCIAPFRISFAAGRQRFTVTAAAGLVALAYYTLFLGMLGLYTRLGLFFSFGVLAACCGLGVRAICLIRREKSVPSQPRWMTTVFVCLTAVLGVFLLSKALWPATYYDAITYHLGTPNYYLLEGAIVYNPYDMFSNFPFLAEMLYTLGLFLSGLKLAQFTSVLVFLLLVSAAYDFCATFLEGAPPALAALFCLAVPCFLEAAIMYNNDLHVAYYVLLSMYCFFYWERSRQAGWLMLTGCFAGACLSLKYTTLTYVPFLLVAGVTTVSLHGRGGMRRCAGNLLRCGLSALIVVAPWLIKNYLSTGNPIYPSLYPLLGGRDMSSEVYANITQMALSTDAGRFFSGLWEHPKRLFFCRPDSFEPGLQRNMGPLILLFLPLLALAKGVRPVAKKMLAAAAAMFVVWSLTFAIARFFYPAAFILLIVSAYGAALVFRQTNAAFRLFIGPAVALYLVMGMGMGLYQVNMRTQTYGFHFLDDSDHAYLMRHLFGDITAVLDSYPAYVYINEHLGPGARVLIVADAQHLYLHRRHVYSYLSATTPFAIFKERAGDPEAIAADLKDRGITHILYNPIELSRLQEAGALAYRQEDNAYIEEFLKTNFVQLRYTDPRVNYPVYVYELR